MDQLLASTAVASVDSLVMRRGSSRCLRDLMLYNVSGIWADVKHCLSLWLWRDNQIFIFDL